MPNNPSPARKLPAGRPSPSRRTPNRPQASGRTSAKNQKPGVLKIVKKNFIDRIHLKPDFDLTFLFLVMILVIIGIVMMFSASYPAALQKTENSYYYLEKQAFFAVIGFIVMWVMASIDYDIFHLLAVPILFVAFLLLIIVLFLPGYPKRWIEMGSFSMQVSEIAKFALIVFIAQWSYTHFQSMQTFRYGVLLPLIIIVLIDVLLFAEPHYSGIVIITLLGAIMMYLGGIQYRWFAIAAGAVALAVLILILTGQLGYAMERLDGWGQALNYEADKTTWDNTYQTRNSLYAIGSGGFWGLGLGQSRQKYMYIPEAQNDFIFAVVCEELGFIGAAFILIIFICLVIRGIMISVHAKDKFGQMLGVGLSAQIGLQVILNILVITDWLPNTGISLPFFSYGGSSLIILMAQMGIILSISRTSNIERT